MAENNSKEKVSEDDKWAVPFNTGIDKLDKVVRALYQQEADKQSVTISKLHGLTEISEDTIKSNLKFLQALKIIKVDVKDGLMFEKKGFDYAKALYKSDVVTTSQTLKELFAESSLKEMMNYIQLNESSNDLTYDAVFSHIRTMARIRENTNYPSGVSDPYKAGIVTLIDLLVRAGILPDDFTHKKENKKEVMKSGQVRKSMSNSQKQMGKQKSPPVDSDNSDENVSNVASSKMPFNININVEVKDAESIKQIIDLIKELKQL